MLYQNALLTSRITELEEQLSVITTRKARKRKYIQTGGTLEYGEAAAQVAEARTALQPSKRARDNDGQDRGQSGQRRCGNCRETGHNARTCQKGTNESPESDGLTSYASSFFDSDPHEDL
jgi:hypothetical protein